MTNKKNFLRGAAILGFAGIITKILGAFFRIPLGNILGDDGMSYYQTAYPMYLFIITISTAGFPTAIAKMISEKRAERDYVSVRKIFKISFYLLTGLGFCGFGILFFSAEWLTKAVGNDLESIYAVKAIAPALLFVPMMSAFRGFFQGMQDLKPYAVSQVVEQIFRVILGFVLVFLFIDKGIAYAAGGATFGAAIGGLFGLVFMILYYLRSRNNIFESESNSNVEPFTNKEILKKLLSIAIPITMGAAVIPVMRLIDLSIVMRRLHSIGIIEEANDLYGQLTGYGNALVNLPAVITVAFQISLVPEISRLKVISEKKLKDTMERAIRIAVIIGLPCSVGLVILSKGIMLLLYPSQLEIVDSVARILNVLGWSVAFLAVFQITTAILQGLNHEKLPAINLFIGAIFKLVFCYILVGIPELNILGAPISTVISYIIASALNIYSIIKYSNIEINIKKMFIKPITVAILMGALVKGSYIISSAGLNSPRLATIFSIFVGIFSYSILLFVFGVIDESDLELIPYGDKFSKFVGKKH